MLLLIGSAVIIIARSRRKPPPMMDDHNSGYDFAIKAKGMPVFAVLVDISFWPIRERASLPMHCSTRDCLLTGQSNFPVLLGVCQMAEGTAAQPARK